MKNNLLLISILFLASFGVPWLTYSLPPRSTTKKLVTYKKSKKHKKLLSKKYRHELALQKAKLLHAQASWPMPRRGRTIRGRFYSAHALERMAPSTPKVARELARRALARGFPRRSLAFKKYVQPRNIAPLWVEEVIRKGKRQREHHHRLKYLYRGNTVITSRSGAVITTY